MLFIGIDPGKSGGIAFNPADQDPTEVNATKMPATERDTWYEINGGSYGKYSDDTFALIEKVGPMPGQGVTSMFSFGRNYGMLRAFLIAAGIPFETVSPQKWQREFGLIVPKSKGLTDTQKKNLHKAKAQELFPHLKITHAIADALLIAKYAQRTWKE